jgi:hypothetical protein
MSPLPFPFDDTNDMYSFQQLGTGITRILGQNPGPYTLQGKILRMSSKEWALADITMLTASLCDSKG